VKVVLAKFNDLAENLGLDVGKRDLDVTIFFGVICTIGNGTTRIFSNGQSLITSLQPPHYVCSYVPSIIPLTSSDILATSTFTGN